MSDPAFRKIAESLSEFDVRKEHIIIQRIKLVFIDLIKCQIQRLKDEKGNWRFQNEGQGTSCSGRSFSREFYSARARNPPGFNVLCSPQSAVTRTSMLTKVLLILFALCLTIICGSYFSTSLCESFPKEIYCKPRAKYVPF